jgi:hypothetical protein
MTSPTTSIAAHETAHDKLQAAIAHLHVMENTFETERASEKLPALTVAEALTGIRHLIEEANSLFSQR